MRAWRLPKSWLAKPGTVTYGTAGVGTALFYTTPDDGYPAAPTSGIRRGQADDSYPAAPTSGVRRGRADDGYGAEPTTGARHGGLAVSNRR